MYERKVWNQDYTRSDGNQQRDQPIKDGRFTEPAVDARFESQSLADGIGGGQRKNARREDRGIQQAGAE